MSLGNGERQVAPTLDGIRRDHVARYEWAAKQLSPASRVIDFACGVGYGAKVLADAGHTVLAIDRSPEAIAYAKKHFAHPNILFTIADAEAERQNLADNGFDAAISFETIEHLKDPRLLLAALRRAAKVLLVSVPNETVFPFRCAHNQFQGWLHHFRHYTRAEFAALLAECGFQVSLWAGQHGPQSDVEADVEGRTLIAKAERLEAALTAEGKIPEHVAIVGLGPSSEEYFRLVKQLGGRHALADETWAINALGDVLACDRIFHMDDVAVQEARAAARPDSNIATMVRWLRTHPGPIYTSTLRPGYPGLVAFPLEEVINAGGMPYLNNTVAYAIAFARYMGVKKLSLYGVDFTYAHSHAGERGRACCEFWIGLCIASGMKIELPEQTPLMDACAPEDELFYGFDGFKVFLRDRDDGGVRVDLEPKPLPTAEEIERRYDHSRPTNRLLAGDTSKS